MKPNKIYTVVILPRNADSAANIQVNQHNTYEDYDQAVESMQVLAGEDYPIQRPRKREEPLSIETHFETIQLWIVSIPQPQQ
jgi:hypothetical protein